MTAKRTIARCTAVTVTLAFVAGISAGAYHDDGGGWVAVAAVWLTLAVLMGAVSVFVWALNNWNAR
ncbi:hypothetical protein ACWGIU_17990 [Streptomyces sp. NPDC054840]